MGAGGVGKGGYGGHNCCREETHLLAQAVGRSCHGGQDWTCVLGRRGLAWGMDWSGSAQGKGEGGPGVLRWVRGAAV